MYADHTWVYKWILEFTNFRTKPGYYSHRQFPASHHAKTHKEWGTRFRYCFNMSIKCHYTYTRFGYCFSMHTIGIYKYIDKKFNTNYVGHFNVKNDQPSIKILQASSNPYKYTYLTYILTLVNQGGASLYIIQV